MKQAFKDRGRVTAIPNSGTQSWMPYAISKRFGEVEKPICPTTTWSVAVAVSV